MERRNFPLRPTVPTSELLRPRGTAPAAEILDSLPTTLYPPVNGKFPLISETKNLNRLFFSYKQNKYSESPDEFDRSIRQYEHGRHEHDWHEHVGYEYEHVNVRNRRGVRNEQRAQAVRRAIPAARAETQATGSLHASPGQSLFIDLFWQR